jgi:hypothetical protein
LQFANISDATFSASRKMIPVPFISFGHRHITHLLEGKTFIDGIIQHAA